MPVSEFCEKIGAVMEWYEKAESLTITYRNSEYIITNERRIGFGLLYLS